MNTKSLIGLGVVVVILAALFVFLKPQQSQAPGGAGQPKVFELTMKGNKLARGPSVIKVTEGDQVVIKVVSDKGDELHLHGYDAMVELLPNTPGELSLTAVLTGRFEYELEGAKIQLGTLEVSPK